MSCMFYEYGIQSRHGPLLGQAGSDRDKMLEQGINV